MEFLIVLFSILLIGYGILNEDKLVEWEESFYAD